MPRFREGNGFAKWCMLFMGIFCCTLSCIGVNHGEMLVRYGATERIVSAKSEPLLFWLHAMIPAAFGVPLIVAAIWIFVLAIQDRFAIPKRNDHAEHGKAD